MAVGDGAHGAEGPAGVPAGAQPGAAVLVVNPGSSSLQVALVDAGRVEAAVHSIRAPDPVIDSARVECPPDSDEAARAVEDFLGRHGDSTHGVVGYRLVHGGAYLREPAVVSDQVLAKVSTVAGLAPLHVPPVLRLVDELRRRMPGVTHVLCPDTAFHRGLPPAAATYPLPADWRRRYDLRRYGFHGLSYAWALRRAGQLLDRDPAELQLILAHLGGGASVTAVRAGTSVDTSMGLTPLDGVPMSTRSGAVDPGLLLWLLAHGGLTVEEVTDGLYRRSGLLGLSGGRSGDTRELVRAGASGDSDAQLALDVYTHRVRREIAAAASSLDRLDGLVFTGEIGWDQPELRHSICAGLGLLGIDAPVTGNREDDGPVSAPGAGVPVLVIRTREEIELAYQVVRLRGVDDTGVA